MTTRESTPSGWRYWIEVPNVQSAECDPVLGALMLRPVDGDDIAISLCPGYAAGQAPQEQLRQLIGRVVRDADESQEIFDFTTFMLPDLIEARTTRSKRVA